jgi:hypothetical protein
VRATTPRSLPHPLTVVLAVALVLAGCGSAPVTPTPAVVPTAPGSGSLAPAASTPPPSTSAPGQRSGPDPAASVALDESLLAVLPPDVGGVPIRLEPDALASALSDPDFARNVEAAAFAVAVDAGDLASGVVARLRPGVYSDALFRDWRDTYNAGACAQAGGVAGNAQADLGGGTVYVATCAGDLRVYHAYLPERGVIVSLLSVGQRRFGEQLMGGLRP